MPETIVDVQGLRKEYRSRSWFKRRAQPALRGVTLRAEAGEVFGILGPNGAGKTTLIKTLLGIVKPTGGTATLFGLPVGSNQARQRVGYLPEALRVDFHHTARSALKYYGGMSRMSSGEIARRSDELLEIVGLRGRDKESVKRFSKGMYQRLGLAQALMHDPDLLVLDEPTDGLDPVGRNDVRLIIQRLQDAGKTIFLNSHILQEVELVCTRVAVLSQGTIRALGTIDELSRSGDGNRLTVRLSCHDAEKLTRPALDRCFLSVAEDLDHDQVELIEFQNTAASQATTVDVKLPVTDQSIIDNLVDRLRTEGISIEHLATSRASLEETFIRLVHETPPTTDIFNVTKSDSPSLMDS